MAKLKDDSKSSVKVVIDYNIPTFPVLADTTSYTVDGIALSNHDRVLVTAQTSPAKNGVYFVEFNDTDKTLKFYRTEDFSGDRFDSDSNLFVEKGNVYANTQWLLESVDNIVVDTTPLIFAQITNAPFTSFKDSYSGTTWTIDHNLNNTNIIYTAWSDAGIQLIPDTATKATANQLVLDFGIVNNTGIVCVIVI